MSGWGLGWFGGGAAPTKNKDAAKNAILGLRSTLEILNKREKHLLHQMAEQDAIARAMVNTSKTAAKTALRRKKQYEHSLEQTQSQMITVEREVGSIETASINKETMNAIKNAGQALKQIRGTLTADKVERAMEDLGEERAIAEEISGMWRESGMSSAMDEDELEEELESLKREELDSKMLKIGSTPQDRLQRLPAAATGELRGKAPARVDEDDEDEELREMQASMAL